MTWAAGMDQLMAMLQRHGRVMERDGTMVINPDNS
jgi:hypothetical protein